MGFDSLLELSDSEAIGPLGCQIVLYKFRRMGPFSLLPASTTLNRVEIIHHEDRKTKTQNISHHERRFQHRQS